METRGILYWLWRGGPPSAPLGPAWVIEADGTGRPINGNDPISRAEAERLAIAGNYTLDAEDVEAARSISN